VGGHERRDQQSDENGHEELWPRRQLRRHRRVQSADREQRGCSGPTGHTLSGYALA
jgi:hypothetical protein